MGTVVHEHPKYGRLELVAGPDDLIQLHIERFADEYRALEGKTNANGKLVRAAVAAGWVLEPIMKVDDVGAKTGQWVAWAGRIIDALYNEATTPDPKVSEPSPATPSA